VKQWYAVYTKPHNEHIADEHLQRQGFEVFLPRYLKRRSHARKVEAVPAPLFPRYIFAAFDPAQPGWRAIRSTRGVIDIVRNGLDPAPVPSGILEEIRRRTDEHGYVVLAHRVDLKPGARFRIVSGPFAEYEAIFSAQKGEDRVVALLSLLGREVVAEVPIEFVAPI
jgi:transcriptional antiterminator RfaH